MRLVKIGIANVNTTVGALQSNTDKAIEFARQISDQGCTVCCFQEQLISGYPCEDLVQWHGFVEEQLRQLRRFAAATQRLPAVFTLGLTIDHNGQLYNCVAVVEGGRVLGIVPKEKLPTYGVFYEMRTFSLGIPGKVSQSPRSIENIPFGDMIFEFPYGALAVEVCEDIWVPDGPMVRRAYSGAELIINASASPYRAGVKDTRREMISTRAADNQATVVYVNQVGGNDALIFDGGGYVNQNGRMLLEAPRWREGFATQVLDLDRTRRLRQENTTWRMGCSEFLATHNPVRRIQGATTLAVSTPHADYPTPAAKSFFLPARESRKDSREEYFDDNLEAMIMGLGDYFQKTGVFNGLEIALSGGKDSALTLIVAWLYARRRFADLTGESKARAIYDFIHCYSLPTRYNSDTTRGIARELAEELGVSFAEESIEDEYGQRVAKVQKLIRTGQDVPRLTRQNIQARIRGSLMWDVSGALGLLWIQTGNMSERAVGYTTIGGDMMGGYSLIGNLPKTVVIKLLGYLYKQFQWKALGELLMTEASAELEENQKDERDLMPFPVLDACFSLFAGEKMMPAELYRVVRSKWTDEELRAMRPDYTPGMLKEWVKKFVRLFVSSIFKWVQVPQTVHLGTLDLDRERALQLPVVQSQEWLKLDEIDALPD